MILTRGARLGSYEIVSPLGAGGMGEVYRARDAKLGRDVALKILPEALFADRETVERFEREARHLAALNHPNIATIHAFEEISGRHLLVMELVEGTTLRDRLDAGPVPPKQAVDFALQIARGLSAAHEKGIVHRDLKPENLFVTRDGHLKILDFGLAKRTEPEKPGDETSAPTASNLTGAGVVMGTVGYMSPEQVKGQAADHRSDLFSFGAVLYEMLSAKKAFKRDSAAETMAAILKEEPSELSGPGPGLPPALDRVVRRCLEKDPRQRFQSAHDLAFALSEASGPAAASFPQAPVAPVVTAGKFPLRFAAGIAALLALAALSYLVWRGKGTPGPKAPASSASAAKAMRIVVLPFENLGAPEDAYFAAGMTEEIIGRLAGLRGLAVISRTTAVAYDRKGKTIGQIGADLGVDYVLEGTVRSERGSGRESRVRISPRLIKVADDTHLWADRYDRGMADIFAIQSDVAENVAKAMGVTLIPREKTALEAVSTKDTEAYDLYLRGLEKAQVEQNRSDQEDAIRLFQQAVDRDPRFAQALARLAHAHLSIFFYHDRFRRPVDRAHLDGARNSVDRLTSLGPDLAEARIARADYAYWGVMDYPRALEEFQAALALQPSSTQAAVGIAFLLRRQGRWKEAAERIAAAQALDPRNPERSFASAVTHGLAGLYPESERMFGLSTSLNPRFGAAWGKRAWLQIPWRGDAERAAALLSEAGRVADLSDDVHVLAYYSFRIALIRRDPGAALRQLDGEKREAYSNQFVYRPVELLRGQAHALAGQTERARGSFEAARRDLAELVRKQPEDARYHSALGIACAGLGLRDEALREANRGVELMPAEKDFWLALWRVEDLAIVQAMLGEQEEAIDRLDFLLSRTGEISAHALRLDPHWDPLRGNPKFGALLAKYGGKG